MEKPPSKVAHNRPQTFSLCTDPAAQPAQKKKSCKDGSMEERLYKKTSFYSKFEMCFLFFCLFTF
jgi:hypothetical protein